MRKNIVTNQQKLLLALGGIALAIALFGLKRMSDAPLPFERTRWLQAREEEDWRLRSRMAKYLITRNALVGQSRYQLVELLGKPENYSDATDQELYYLIREDWDGVDPVRVDHLLITTDTSGRAVRTVIKVFRKPGY